MFSRRVTRREALRTGAVAGAGLAAGALHIPSLSGLSQQPILTKPIPSSGERLPVVGVGTNRFGVRTPEDMAPLREVLGNLPDLGGKVVDTANGYGRSEEVIGELVSHIGNRDRLFIATKATARDGDTAAGIEMLELCFRRLQTDRIDLMQVHNLRGTAELFPVLREWKAAGRIRYYGMTTSSDRQYEQMVSIMRGEEMDFIQVDYSIDNRGSAETILPLAQERGMAVLINVPFGGRRGSLFSRVSEVTLPEWAAEFGATSWAQFFLKYIVSHPAVTCAIPGTTQLRHLQDNMGALAGELPVPEMRRRMEQFWDALG